MVVIVVVFVVVVVVMMAVVAVAVVVCCVGDGCGCGSCGGGGGVDGGDIGGEGARFKCNASGHVLHMFWADKFIHCPVATNCDCSRIASHAEL